MASPDRLKPVILAALLAACSIAAAAEPPSNDELRAMNRADAADRSAEQVDWTAVDRNDAKRRGRVLALLRESRIRTGEDFYNAAMIFQHGEGAEDIRLAHALATISARLAPDHPAPKWLIAASWDRMMVWKNMPQWYGTQSRTSPSTGVTSLYPVDPKAVTDEERKALNVPTLAESAGSHDSRKASPAGEAQPSSAR